MPIIKVNVLLYAGFTKFYQSPWTGSYLDG